MTPNGSELAARFATASDTFVDLVEQLTPEQWQSLTPEEGWPVGFVARHVAWGMLAEAKLVERVAAGDELIGLTMDEIHESNERNLAKHRIPDQSHTLELLRRYARFALDVIEGLSAEQLARSADITFIGRRVSAAGLVDGLLIWHIRSHQRGIETAIATIDNAEAPAQ